MLPIVLAVALSANLPSGPELEKLFWDCDFASSTNMLGMGDAATCSIIFEKFRTSRFKDFNEFMVYWKQNKEREHKARTK